MTTLICNCNHTCNELIITVIITAIAIIVYNLSLALTLAYHLIRFGRLITIMHLATANIRVCVLTMLSMICYRQAIYYR